MSLKSTSKLIALALRHKPDAVGITLDEHGWARVDELIVGVNKSRPLTMEILEEIVEKDEKGRFSFSEDKTLIRANQGHSIPVDVELKETTPPPILYHGTAEKFVDSIEKIGLIPKSRLYVHLSADYETALSVGARHGKAVVYQIDTKEMMKNNCKFFISKNGVWLTDSVLPEYLRRIINTECSND
ncbi:MAG: RNA 2'-phosphotransferase [Clostridia bacterium]|nr:RNA 2'-phosphotransferase [Clostridia bacterium]